MKNTNLHCLLTRIVVKQTGHHVAHSSNIRPRNRILLPTKPRELPAIVCQLRCFVVVGTLRPDVLIHNEFDEFRVLDVAQWDLVGVYLNKQQR